jgi:drug/metabolite transporter (DMT)-like permease
MAARFAGGMNAVGQNFSYKKHFKRIYQRKKSIQTMLPVFCGILTSLCFAIASLLAQRGYHLAAAPWGAWITLVGNSVLLLAAHFLFYPETKFLAADNLIFVGVGLFVPGVTRVLSFRGVRVMGSSITSTIVNTTPVFSTVLAITVLGERPGPLVVAGVLFTVSGLITVSWAGATASYRKIELIFPFLCALIFSLKDITVRWGLGDGGGQPVFAAAVAAVTSSVEIFLITRYVYGEKFTLPPFNIARWFIWSGLFTGGSFLFMYLAFSMEQVSIVAPLINSYVVFVLLLTPLVARRIETVTWRKAIGAALVVAGIFMVSTGKN